MRIIIYEEKRAAEVKGETNGMAKAVRALMESLQCTKERAMELLDIPANLQPEILTML